MIHKEGVSFFSISYATITQTWRVCAYVCVHRFLYHFFPKLYKVKLDNIHDKMYIYLMPALNWKEVGSCWLFHYSFAWGRRLGVEYGCNHMHISHYWFWYIIPLRRLQSQQLKCLLGMYLLGLENMWSIFFPNNFLSKALDLAACRWSGNGKGQRSEGQQQLD